MLKGAKENINSVKGNKYSMAQDPVRARGANALPPGKEAAGGLFEQAAGAGRPEPRPKILAFERMELGRRSRPFPHGGGRDRDWALGPLMRMDAGNAMAL